MKSSSAHTAVSDAVDDAMDITKPTNLSKYHDKVFWFPEQRTAVTQ